MNKSSVVIIVTFASTLALQPLQAYGQSERSPQHLCEGHALKVQNYNLKALSRSASQSVKEPLMLANAWLAQGDSDTASGDNSDAAQSNDADSSTAGSSEASSSKSSGSDSTQSSGTSSGSAAGNTDTASGDGAKADTASDTTPSKSDSASTKTDTKSDAGKSDSTTDTAQVGEPDDTKVLQEVPDPKLKQSIEKGQEQLSSGNLGGAVSNFLKALKMAQRLENDKLLELTHRKLGQAYYQKEDFPKAYDTLSNGLTICQKLGIRDSLLEDAITKVSKNYKTIEMTVFPDDIVKQMRNAGVQKIAVLKQEAGHLITFDLSEKYTKSIGNEDVNEMGFAKKVSFQFLEKDGGGSYQLTGMKGLTAKAKGMWVNLMDTLLTGGSGTAPKAQVTAGKMGIQKTVNVDVPDDLYGTARDILVTLSKAIQSPPVFARTGNPQSE